MGSLLSPIVNCLGQGFGFVFGKSELGATIVDALDSLLVMGLEAEAADARRFIAEELNFDVDVYVSVFEAMIRFVGGLLSAFALTDDRLYLDKAVDLCTRLLPAFNTQTGIPIIQVAKDLPESVKAIVP